MKDSYIKFILATVIFGTNGIIASHIPLSSYEIVLCRTVLGGREFDTCNKRKTLRSQ